jgi:RNA polymerase sigma-70 factor (ECF subfamily)
VGPKSNLHWPWHKEPAAGRVEEASSPPTLDALFKQHSAYVARLAYRLLGREDEVDDITQDVFVSLFSHLSRVRDVGAMRGWLATTTVRMVRRRLRVRRIGFLLSFRARTDPYDLPSDALAGDERAALLGVHRALAGVASSARVAWILRYVEEERIEDVARMCRCSVATAKRRIAVAHRAVRGAVVDD